MWSEPPSSLYRSSYCPGTRMSNAPELRRTMLEILTLLFMLPEVVDELAETRDDIQTAIEEREVEAQEAAQAEAERIIRAAEEAAAQEERAAREAEEAERAATQEASVTHDLPPAVVGEPWQSLADCESGNWQDGGNSFERNSARWDWAKDGQVPPWGTTIHHGGLQFHPDTWTWLKPEGFPQFAYDATPAQQVAVAERVLEAQGWQAWPVCSRKVGLR